MEDLHRKRASENQSVHRPGLRFGVHVVDPAMQGQRLDREMYHLQRCRQSSQEVRLDVGGLAHTADVISGS